MDPVQTSLLPPSGQIPLENSLVLQARPKVTFILNDGTIRASRVSRSTARPQLHHLLCDRSLTLRVAGARQCHGPHSN